MEWLTSRDWVGTPPLLQLSDDGRHDATIGALADIGVHGEDQTLVMFAPPGTTSSRSDSRVTIAAHFGDPWHSCWADVSGAGQDLGVAREFFEALPGVIVARVDADDAVESAAVGLGVVVGEGVYIAAMATRPHERGRGHARSIVQAIREAAGGVPAVLNVVCSNPAVGLYESLGFVVSHSYAYYDLESAVRVGGGGSAEVIEG